MLASQRRHKILELLTEDGSAKVSGLSEIFKISEVTIRQALDNLDQHSRTCAAHSAAQRSVDGLSPTLAAGQPECSLFVPSKPLAGVLDHFYPDGLTRGCLLHGRSIQLHGIDRLSEIACVAFDVNGIANG